MNREQFLIKNSHIEDRGKNKKHDYQKRRRADQKPFPGTPLIPAPIAVWIYGLPAERTKSGILPLLG